MLTEFFDPYEHLYDGQCGLDPWELVPQSYYVAEVARRTGWAEPQVYDWFAARLLMFRPSMAMLVAIIRHELRRAEADWPGGCLGDQTDVHRALLGSDDDALGAAVFRDHQLHDLSLATTPNVIKACDETAEGLRVRQPFIAACGGIDKPRFARALGMCVAYRTWSKLDGLLHVDPDSFLITPHRKLYVELRKQIAMARRPHIRRNDHPALRQWWLTELIEARLRAACCPR